MQQRCQNTSSESTDNAANEGELSLDQKREIARWIADGMGLSDVQKELIKTLASS